MSNDCNCPKPPGGKVSCSSNQIAICAVIDGELIAKCISVPPKYSSMRTAPNFYRNQDLRIRRRDSLANWIMNQIDPSIDHPDLSRNLAILRSGEYEDSRMGNIVNFIIPEGIMQLLSQDNDSGRYRTRSSE
jgi:hypothetical protein